MASSKLILIFMLLNIFINNTLSLSENPRANPYEDELNEWCNNVPYPESCKHFMSYKLGADVPTTRDDFRKMIIEVAMERAQAAMGHAWHYGRKCSTHQERAAWIDCIRLYDNTIIQLNRTLQGLTDITTSCNNFDAQTWLSTALTNLDTCRIGSEDMNVTDLLWPHVSYNMSELLSNSLDVNQKIILEQNNEYNDTSDSEGYPSWVSREDRRLLRGSRSMVESKADFVVAQDGSSRYKTIQSAIDAAEKSDKKGRKVIQVKKGVYRENIHVGPYNNDIMLVGEGMRHTIVTASRSTRRGSTTYNSATAGIDGLRFIAREITFQNAAGPNMGQAVALRSGSDLSVFYKCAFYGYQDTLCVHSQRQFYKMCYIFGTIDIIFGNAAAVFQDCIIRVRKPIWGQANIITAQGRADPNQNTGIVIHRSRIEAADDFKPMIGSVDTFLGRPWKKFSRTIIMKSYLDKVVSPKGWSPWSGKRFLDTLYYAEYKNSGPGSKTKERVKWRGYHVITNQNEASKFTVGSFISGQEWLPSTGVPFRSGL